MYGEGVLHLKASPNVGSAMHHYSTRYGLQSWARTLVDGLDTRNSIELGQLHRFSGSAQVQYQHALKWEQAEHEKLVLKTYLELVGYGDVIGGRCSTCSTVGPAQSRIQNGQD